jgi:hypothetical protein
MTSKQLAAQLRAAGIRIRSTSEGDAVVDGAVIVNDAIHVQVPTDGGRCGVRRQVGDVIEFLPDRATVVELVRDIRAASKQARVRTVARVSVR